MGAGLWLARQIINDMNGMEPSAWILWQVIDNHICADGYMGKQDSGMDDTSRGYWGTVVADHDKEAEVIRTSGSMADGEKWKELEPVQTMKQGLVVTLKADSVTTFIIHDVE